MLFDIIISLTQTIMGEGCLLCKVWKATRKCEVTQCSNAMQSNAQQSKTKQCNARKFEAKQKSFDFKSTKEKREKWQRSKSTKVILRFWARTHYNALPLHCIVREYLRNQKLTEIIKIMASSKLAHLTRSLWRNWRTGGLAGWRLLTAACTGAPASPPPHPHPAPGEGTTARAHNRAVWWPMV